MSEYQFSPYTPLYHDNLDDWGLAKGTRLWSVDGGFVKAEEVSKGDLLFGITFRLEDEYLPIHSGTANPADNIVKVWAPVLTAREVLSVRTIKARAWQLTFGEHTKAYESRRLVAGADTHVTTFPLTHQFTASERLVDLHTAVDNPRKGSLTREAMIIDSEASIQEGSPVYMPTPFTGQPRGDYTVVIPYEAYGGQTGMLRQDIRPYKRYLFTQVHDVLPIMPECDLIQIQVKADTLPEFGVMEGQSRCNLIAQTPFAEEKKRRRVAMDHLATEVGSVKQSEEFAQRWDEWANKQHGKKNTSRYEEVETVTQGQFYDSQNKSLEAFGVKGGFLNGGILINLPEHHQNQ